ncbi:MAG: C40 family peptidase [Pseudomonadota bacterium]
MAVRPHRAVTLDPRLNPIRDDLAAATLRGTVDRPRYADGEPATITAPLVPVFGKPDGTARVTEFLRGEPVTIFDIAGGIAWAQSADDGYVGYIDAGTFAPSTLPPTHRVPVPSALVFDGPSIRARLMGTLPLSARVAVVETLPGGDTFHRLSDETFVLDQHLAPVAEAADDPVTLAERFTGAPYLWGGKSVAGLDCSALVQLAFGAAGIPCPRDSDMQEALGTAVPPEAIARGDLVFWKGHVGIMTDEKTLLHANGHHMMTMAEPLETAAHRLAAKNLPITAIRRFLS